MTQSGPIDEASTPKHLLDHHSDLEFAMKFSKSLFLSICLVLVFHGAYAQETQDHALADTEISYTYEDGGAVTLTVRDGKLSYLWTAGPFAGVEVRDLDYYSKELAENLFLVSWHDPNNKNFVTLIFDLDQMIEHGTALIGYETDTEVTLFDEARIDSVRIL